MAKKTKKAEVLRTQQLQNLPVIPSFGKKLIGGGVVLLVVGFFVLTRTDSYGQNWASHLAPFLLLAGYSLIAAGIFCPSPPAIGSTNNSPMTGGKDVTSRNFRPASEIEKNQERNF